MMHAVLPILLIWNWSLDTNVSSEQHGSVTAEKKILWRQVSAECRPLRHLIESSHIIMDVVSWIPYLLSNLLHLDVFVNLLNYCLHYVAIRMLSLRKVGKCNAMIK
jgi:hypothetical protein